MSVEELTNSNQEKVAVEQEALLNQAGTEQKPKRPTKKRKRKKATSQITMLIRRIHLYSGLFMLPWVLLYGFTALLFNHPTYMTDSKTQIEHFSLSDEDREKLPTANAIAEQIVNSANKKLSEAGQQKIELSDSSIAGFQRQAVGSMSDKEQSVTLVLDINSGQGYVRKREVAPRDENENKDEVSLENGLDLTIGNQSMQQIKASVAGVLEASDVDAEKVRLRGIPTLEFDAIIDGEKKRVRFTSNSSRRGRGNSSSSKSSKGKPGVKGKLTIVGQSPREMSLRSYLLRLHMAHGYPVQKNSRWFWAIAVDLMFASMVFWGLSGVVMWWQIKRTRRIGFVILLASGAVAAFLAYGMHWQLTNG